MSAPTKSRPSVAPTIVRGGMAMLTEDEMALIAKRRSKAAKRLLQREEVAEQSRHTAQIRLAAEELVRSDALVRRRQANVRWMVRAVVGVLLFQVFHSYEHLAQVLYWLTHTSQPPWMSPLAMGASSFLSTATGSTPFMGMLLLHLIGNGIFLGGLLIALRIPGRYAVSEARLQFRRATLVQGVHFAEHALLTVSTLLFGKTIGISTLFGALTPNSSPEVTGYWVFFHLTINLVATAFALKGAAAVRNASPPAGPALGGPERIAVAALLAGVVLLLAIFWSGLGKTTEDAPAHGDAVHSTEILGQP